MSEIVIIGSGNVAYHLAKAFVDRGISVKQIFGRNLDKLTKIGQELSVEYSNQKLADADIYIICVSDDAVSEVSKKIMNKKGLVAHTSGSLPKESLLGDYRKASFYPLQTFSRNKSLVYSKIPFFIDAEFPQDAEALINIASKISSNVMEIDFDKRKYVHLTAVFSCNFVNHLYANAKEISDSQNIPFSYFLPLIEETTKKIFEVEPKLAQTGPAVRNDKRILELHESLIEDEMKLRIYKLMNESIKRMYEL